MTHWAYYNEIDPHAAQWLRNLIKAGHIAPGVVDTRSIIDVRPYDLRGFTQCHFFAGVGVWSHALRRAGWGDDRRVWTGSCPCQPFSSAGRGLGLVDERHLWPFWYHLIDQRNPPVIFGEQVANSDAMPWLDLVQDDLEGMGYTVGAVPFPAASVGAPHIRDRLYFVARSDRHGREGGGLHLRERGSHEGVPVPGRCSEACELANSGGGARLEVGGLEPARQELEAAERGGNAGGLVEPGSGRRVGWEGASGGGLTDRAHAGRIESDDGLVGTGQTGDTTIGELGDTAGSGRGQGGCDAACRPATGGERSTTGGGDAGPANGFWADADWIPCRDGKARPVEPGTFPLAHGVAGRVGRLRAYGNGLCAAQAQLWVEVVMECLA